MVSFILIAMGNPVESAWSTALFVFIFAIVDFPGVCFVFYGYFIWCLLVAFRFAVLVVGSV